MQVIKEKLEIEESLKKRIINLHKFQNIKGKDVKNATTEQIKDYYDNNDFEQDNIYDIAVDTDKKKELF